MFWNDHTKEILELQAQNNLLQQQVYAMSDDIEAAKALLGPEFGEDRRGKFTSYVSQITGLREKFHNLDPLGADICSAVIRLRTAFIKGAGIKVVNKTARPGNRTYKWFKEFLERNKVNTTFLSNVILGGEFEGKALIVLKKRKDQIELRYIPYHGFNYSVNVSPKDYMEIENVKYSVDGAPQVTVLPSQMVFIKLGGDVDNYDETYPRLGTMLSDFEAFSMALANWRKTNRICASPTPHIDFEDEATARQFLEDQKSTEEGMRWKIGQLLVTANATFEMVNAGKESQESLENEILTRGKVISAGTGIPVHFIGLPELMSNRSTADNLRDLISVSIQYERATYLAAMLELKDKVIGMANDMGEALNKDDITIEMPFVGQQELENLKDIFLPLRNSSAISTRTFLKHVPFVDNPQEEIDEIIKEKEMFQEPEQNLPGVDTRNQDVSRVSQRAIPSGTARNGQTSTPD